MKNNLLRTYIVGFVLSLVLTMLAYFLVTGYISSPHGNTSLIMLIGAILVIAMVQLVVQLIFFLHLSKEPAQRWNVIFFVSTFMSVLLVIVASIWIMTHLNYRMTPHQVDQYIQNQSGL